MSATTPANATNPSVPGTQAAVAGSAPAPPIPDLIDLPTGKELNEAAAVSFAAARPVRLVVLAGPVDCGKTTLLTSLYELFQWKTVSGQNFAGSVTLPGFEQRCYLARAASGGFTPETQRTVYKGPDPYYLHLRVSADDPPYSAVDFLFTDVSGEMFEHARNSTAECKELTFLKRATNFLLMLDSEKAMHGEGLSIAHNSQSLLQQCVDNRMLQQFCVVNVLWTKIDHDQAATPAARDEHRRFRTGVQRQFETMFAHRVPHLMFSEVAARPTEAPELGFGKGVPELLEGWVNFCPRARTMDLAAAIPSVGRESELFAARHFATPGEK